MSPIEIVLEDIESGNAFGSELLFSNDIDEQKFGDKVYSKDYGDVEVEMTVLTQGSVRAYNGIAGLGGTFDWVTDPVTYLSTEFGLVDAQLDDYIQYKNPRKVLRGGDVRISTSTPVQETGTSYRVDYFFRDGKLLYAENSATGEMILGVDYGMYYQEMEDYLYN